MGKNIIEARSLVKYFDGRAVINGVHLAVPLGETIVVLGSPGSGKTTLLSLLATFLAPSAGDLFIDGRNVKAVGESIRQNIGFVMDVDLFDEQLNVEENLWIYARYMGLSVARTRARITESMRFFELAELADRSPQSLNKFERHCFRICRANLHEPPLLIVDELLSGLSLLEQNFLADRLKDLKALGKTIVFSTDSLTEASGFADRVGILAGGRLELDGAPAAIIEKEIGYEVVEFDCRENELDYVVAKIQSQYEYRSQGTRVYVYIRQGQDSRNLLDMIASDDLALRKARLSDVVKKLELSH